MINLLLVLAFVSLYGLSIAGTRMSPAFFVSGFLLHMGYVLYRWYELGWLPVTERHDILVAMAFAVACSFFYFYGKVKLPLLFGALPLFVITLSVFAIFQGRFNTIDPIMNSTWFYLYSSFFTIGAGFFTIGTVAGIFFLSDDTPVLEMMQYRFILYGWILFSFSLIGGSFWFYLTYGSYWLWTAKELWITIVWFFYSFYLHGRFYKPLRGRPASYVGLAGFPILLFSYLGVMPILGSPWTQF